MKEQASSTTYVEFEREARRIEELVWAAMAIESGTHVLFCGFENSRGPIERAMREGALVTVVESKAEAIRDAEALGVTVLRGSSSALPAKPNTYGVTVAYHYLHEVDPFFHGQVVSELARVGRRIVVVEPGPPTDPLGRRIASLYSRAKRELGQFEYYQNLEYWRKLLTGVRAVVAPSIITFASHPPNWYLHDTIALLLEMIRIGGAPEQDLRELQVLASTSDAQLLPQPRYVLLAAANAAEIPSRPRLAELEARAPRSQQTLRHQRRETTQQPAVAVRAPQPSASRADEPARQPVEASVEPLAGFSPQPPIAPFSGLPFGAQTTPPSSDARPTPPFGEPFAVPPVEEGTIAAAFGVPPIPPPAENVTWGWQPSQEVDIDERIELFEKPSARRQKPEWEGDADRDESLERRSPNDPQG